MHLYHKIKHLTSQTAVHAFQRIFKDNEYMTVTYCIL